MSSVDQFVIQWRERLKSGPADMAATLGIEAMSASDTHVEMAMPFRSDIGQATGLFSTGALIQLADVAATLLCIRTFHQRDPAAARETYFPLSVQMNAHLIGNTDSGRAIARSTLVSAGRTLVVAHTVRDDQGQDLILLTSAHLIKAVKN